MFGKQSKYVKKKIIAESLKKKTWLNFVFS